MTLNQELINSKYPNKIETTIINIKDEKTTERGISLKDYPNLQKLILNGNGMDDLCYSDILESIPNKDKITILDFSDNEVANLPIFDYIQENFLKLEELRYWDNPVYKNKILRMILNPPYPWELEEEQSWGWRGLENSGLSETFKDLDIENDLEKIECVKECHRLLGLAKSWLKETYGVEKRIDLLFIHKRKDGTFVNNEVWDTQPNGTKKPVNIIERGGVGVNDFEKKPGTNENTGDATIMIVLDRRDGQDKFQTGLVLFCFAHELSHAINNALVSVGKLPEEKYGTHPVFHSFNFWKYFLHNPGGWTTYKLVKNNIPDKLWKGFFKLSLPSEFDKDLLPSLELCAFWPENNLKTLWEDRDELKKPEGATLENIRDYIITKYVKVPAKKSDWAWKSLSSGLVEIVAEEWKTGKYNETNIDYIWAIAQVHSKEENGNINIVISHRKDSALEKKLDDLITKSTGETVYRLFATKNDEVNSKYKELQNLLDSTPLTEFQRKNYNTIINTYKTSVLELATDFDALKKSYDELAENSPQKQNLKTQLDQKGAEIKTVLASFDLVRDEIKSTYSLFNNLSNLSKITEINSKLDKIAAATVSALSVNNIQPTTTVDLTATNTKIDEVSKKVDNIKSTSCSCDISKIIMAINSSENQKINQQVAEKMISGNNRIRDYNNKKKGQGFKNPIFTTDKDTFIKGVKEESNEVHILLWKDPDTGLWGFFWNSMNSSIVCYFSPNEGFYDVERNNAEKWFLSQGTGKTVNKLAGRYNGNKEGRADYSLAWCIGVWETIVIEWNKNNRFEWNYVVNENNWPGKRANWEAELNRYKSGSEQNHRIAVMENNFSPQPQKNSISSVKALGVFGIVSALLITGLLIVKKRFNKRESR